MTIAIQLSVSVLLIVSNVANSAKILDHGYRSGTESLDFKDFPLRKCYCGANEFWQNGTCVGGITWVEYITSYSPLKSVRIYTSDTTDLFVSRVTCKDSTPIHVKNVAFNAPNTLFHQESGDHFQKYCVEHMKDDEGNLIMTAIVCLPVIEMPVCCPEGHVLNSSNLSCSKHENISNSVPIHIGTSVTKAAQFNKYVQNVIHCESAKAEKTALTDDKGQIVNELQFRQAKLIFFAMESDFLLKMPPDYCVAVEPSSTGSSYSVYSWHEKAPEICQNYSRTVSARRGEMCERVMYWALLPLLVLSSVCLIVILALHALLPELRKSIGSKITLAHVASLLCGFLVLVILHIPIEFNCKVFGPIVQGCFLATFFWLNVMCFDLWWKLRFRSPAGDDQRHARTKFVKYSIYAWGSPLLIVIVTVVMDNADGLQDSSLILPGFGIKHCWFANREATLVYYFGIIAALMAINLVLFVLVFIKLIQANYSYKKVMRDEDRNPRRNTWIYLKIFGVMGITWICEFFSWQEGTCTYWIVTDIINSLRGLILFVIFFGNKKSFRKIKSRFNDINDRLQTQFNQSMNNLRKISLKPSSTAESTLDRCSESFNEAKVNGHQNPAVNEATDP